MRYCMSARQNNSALTKADEIKVKWKDKDWQPIQYSCLENPTDRGAWWATVHGVAKSWT